MGNKVAKADMLFYMQPDELVFRRHAAIDAVAIKALCCRARGTADRLSKCFRTRSASRIAEQLGIGVSREGWVTAEGRIFYLGECTLFPPQINLNILGVRRLAKALFDVQYNGSGWQSEECLQEVIVAHELHHIVEPRYSRLEAELAAHAFARELLAMPFSPLLFHRMDDLGNE
jgi:hypothetical protein